MQKKLDKTTEKTRSYLKFSASTKTKQRWISLKNHLGFHTDDEFIVYLLNLADSMIDQKDKSSCPNAELCKPQYIKEDNVLLQFGQGVDSGHNFYHDNVLRHISRRTSTTEDVPTSECWENPKKSSSSLHNTGKLKQLELKNPSKPLLGSKKTKRHKNKSRCHRDRYKKKKSQKAKDEKILATVENKTTQRISPKHNLKSDSITQPFVLHNDQIVERNVHLHSKDIENTNEIKVAQLHLNENLENDLKYELETNRLYDDKRKEFCSMLEPQELNQSLVKNVSKISEDLSKIKNEQIPSHVELSENNKEQSKKRIASLKQSNCEIVSGYKNNNGKHTQNDHVTTIFDVSEPTQNKKLDVGVKVSVSSMVGLETLNKGKLIEMNNEALEPAIESCKKCEAKHLQGVCPWMEPDYIIEDSISFINWKNKHKNNPHVVQCIDSNDSMSKGYSDCMDNISDIDQEIIKQSKAKCNMHYEESQENINPDWPLFARESLPSCLELKISNTNHGLGVFVTKFLPIYTQFGPLIGKPVQEMDIPDDYSMKHIWEVSSNGKTHYISTTNPLTSNWIRYLRPSVTKETKNVNIVEKNGQLFIITCQTLMAGTELIYWLDSQSQFWVRKNKIDKTNCGGCNLKFAHPIYYRLHCCIFHDTNYSLTIRKYHCKICGIAVLGKDNIMKHASEFHAGRGAYQCQYCKKFFLRLNYLEMHRNYGCSQNPSRSRPLCDFCGRKFCQPQKLKVHIKRMHSDQSEALEEFQCKLCSKLLGSRAALQRHMKEVHHKDVVGAATCDRCGKTFQNKSNLKIHMLTHSGVKPFECKEDKCNAAFTTKQCLQFHYKKVHRLSDETMPKIERSIAYTFDAYSGGVLEDLERGQTTKFILRSNDDFPFFDDCSRDGNGALISRSSRCLKKKSKKSIKESSQETNNGLEKAESLPVSTNMNLDTCEVSHTSDDNNKADKLEVTCATPASETLDNEHNNRQRSETTQSAYLILANDEKLDSISCKRQESYNASLLVEAALDAAERDIGMVSIPSLGGNEQENPGLYSVPNEPGFKSIDYQVTHESADSHMDSYVHDELVNSSTVIPSSRQALPIDAQYRSSECVNTSHRPHGIEPYLEHEIATSPRYDEMINLPFNVHSQMQSLSYRLMNDPVSSDDSDSAVQNLSLPVKDKTVQQIVTSKYSYESDFTSENKSRVKFETSMSHGAKDHGLDMSARGFQQTCGPQIQNGNHLFPYHHHHHHHSYRINESERQGVDLSMSAPCISPSYTTIYSPYSHFDVPRVATLESTSKSHQLHTALSRVNSSPQPENLLSSLSSENAEVRIFASASPTPVPTYTSAHSMNHVYHAPRSGYHYSNYY